MTRCPRRRWWFSVVVRKRLRWASWPSWRPGFATPSNHFSSVGCGFSCRFWFWLRWSASMVVPPAVRDSRWLRQRFSSPSSQRRRSFTHRGFESTTIWFWVFLQVLVLAAVMVVPPAVHDSRWRRQRFSSPSSQRRRSVPRRGFESATIWFCDLGFAFWVLSRSGDGASWWWQDWFFLSLAVTALGRCCHFQWVGAWEMVMGKKILKWPLRYFGCVGVLIFFYF